MIHAVTWQWGTKYGPHYADRLRAAVARHLPGARFLVATPSKYDADLTRIRGCFARMRVFEPEWQAAHGIAEGDTILSLDLDLVITRSLVGMVDRPEPFCILQGVNAVNPCRYNGSVYMLRAGYRLDVWSEFTLERAEAVRVAAFADDQRWFEHMLPDAGAFGPEHGVYGFLKPGWPRGTELPGNARIVAFFGWRDPSQFTTIPWVREHWR